MRRFHAENIRNICCLSAFVKAPLVGIGGESWRCIHILACGISSHQVSTDGVGRLNT